MKAFFAVHLAVALLAALGLQALANGRRRLTLALAAGALGALLVATPLLPHAFPGPLGSFAAAFFPPGFAPDARAALLDRVLRDAATGGAVALAVALVALLASRGARVLALSAASARDGVARRGARGRRPAADRRRAQPDGLEELLRAVRRARRAAAARCARAASTPARSRPARRSTRAGSARGADHELWSFAVLLETLSPSFNVPRGVPTALSPDLTMLVPTERILAPEEGSCTSLAPLLPRLREAAVTTVLSLDPLEHPELAPLFVLARPGREPVAVHAYALRDPLPRFALTGPAADPRRARGSEPARARDRGRARRRRSWCATPGPRAGARASTAARAEMPRRRHRELPRSRRKPPRGA